MNNFNNKTVCTYMKLAIVLWWKKWLCAGLFIVTWRQQAALVRAVKRGWTYVQNISRECSPPTCAATTMLDALSVTKRICLLAMPHSSVAVFSTSATLAPVWLSCIALVCRTCAKSCHSFVMWSMCGYGHVRLRSSWWPTVTRYGYTVASNITLLRRLN